MPSEQEVVGRIRLEMEKHLREQGAPEEVHDFLVRHWARLMAGVFMAKGNQHADWMAGWDTVNALLWSLAPKQGQQEAEHMLRMLPTILARLHEGCDALSVPRAERDQFFQHLAMMHAAVAREGLRFQTETGAAQPALAASGEVIPPSQKSRDAAGEQAPPTPPPSLRPGDRVHLSLGGEDRILMVHWVSPLGGMYLFTNDQGLDALTLTRARLAERFAAGTARMA
ncbi:MAG: DUF1631 domain-containing protein [Thiobacillaceae bacterium]|nr:DUF1631 domain-containing protein [Thiobacillaceae bacterium]